MVAKTVVIARYDEDVAWTNDLPNDVQFFIVQKGEHVPNIGRESYSYLWYIIEYYKHLQGLYFFLQGHPFDHIINLDLNDWTPRFVGVRKITEADGSPEHTGLLVGDFAKQADIQIQFPFEFTAGAQFCVTAKQIKNHAFRYYKKWFKMHEKYHDAPWIMERLWEHILF